MYCLPNVHLSNVLELWIYVVNNMLTISDDKLDRMSAKILGELENIDDDAEAKDIVMVKIDIEDDNKHILDKFNIPANLPKLALFEDDQPVQIYENDLEQEEEALKWLVQATIEQVPVAMNLKKPEPVKAPEAPKAPVKSSQLIDHFWFYLSLFCPFKSIWANAILAFGLFGLFRYF